jgi:hypothetical protein
MIVVVGVVAFSSWARGGEAVPDSIANAFEPKEQFKKDFGSYQSPLIFQDGRPVRNAADWERRREEIRTTWNTILGPPPPLIAMPSLVVLAAEHRENFEQKRVRVEIAEGKTTDGYLLVPDGKGPFPAMLVVFYEPETAVGIGIEKGHEERDFALQLVRHGYAALSIGLDPYALDPAKSGLTYQPLSYLAYVAANCRNAMASQPEIDPKRIGVMGHSYGGKWAMFASCLYDSFACGVWSDPGIVFDESRPNVNYWEPWYLGWEPGKTRGRGILTPENPRTGAYKALMDQGHDLHELHALMAPRPFLVSGGSEDPPERWRALNHAVAVNALLGVENRVAMTNRPAHSPSAGSNAEILEFLDFVLKPAPGAR